MPAISFTVDLVPLLLLVAVVLCSASYAVALVAKSPQIHGRHWALGGALASAGLWLIVMRGSVPDALSIALGNSLTLLGQAYVSSGTSRYIGRNASVDIRIGVVAALVFVCAYWLGADTMVRVTIYTSFCCVFALRITNGFYQAKRTFANWVALGAAVLVGFIEFIRAILVVANVVAIDSQVTLNGLSVSLGIPAALIVAASVVMLHRENFGALVGVKSAEVVTELGDGEKPSQAAAWMLLSDRAVLVAPDGTEIRLTGNEYMVLDKLGEMEDAVDRLTLNAVIGRSLVDPKDRGIDILISRLRRKCTDVGIELPINALRGRGYVFLAVLQRL